MDDRVDKIVEFWVNTITKHQSKPNSKTDWFLILLDTVLYWMTEFNSNELFKINRDCASKNVHHMQKNLVKFVQKLLEPLNIPNLCEKP